MKLKAILLLSVCILVACQKRKYPEENVQLEKEDIFFNGSVDNQPINLKIGTDGYYCYSSYKQGVDSIYVFEGTLKKFNCNPCPLALSVQLSDYRQRLPGASVPADSALRTGVRTFLSGTSKSSTIKFMPYSNKAAASFRWQLSNGVVSQDSIMSCEFTQPGPQTVSLTIRTKGNCESMVINKLFIGGTTGILACSITGEPLQNNGCQFNPTIIGGTPPFRYSWNFGDGSTSTSSSPMHTYNWTGSYPVKLRIEDAENHVCESNYIYIAGNDKSSCATNMSLLRTGSKNISLNGVKIQWTDESNTALRSDSVAQPAGSYFEILKSEVYAPNEKGEPGQLLTLRFNVLLAKGNRRVWLKSESATIAVTYK